MQSPIQLKFGIKSFETVKILIKLVNLQILEFKKVEKLENLGFKSGKSLKRPLKLGKIKLKIVKITINKLYKLENLKEKLGNLG